MLTNTVLGLQAEPPNLGFTSVILPTKLKNRGAAESHLNADEGSNSSAFSILGRFSDSCQIADFQGFPG